MIESVKPEGKTYEEAKKKDDEFFPFCPIRSGEIHLHLPLSLFLAIQKIETPKGNEHHLSTWDSTEKMVLLVWEKPADIIRKKNLRKTNSF